MIVLEFENLSQMMAVISSPTALCARVEGLQTLPIAVVYLCNTFKFAHVTNRFRLKLAANAASQVVLIVSKDVCKCLVAGICPAAQVPKSIADLRSIAGLPKARRQSVPKSPTRKKRTLKDLTQLLSSAQHSLRRGKYAAFRDDKGFALLTALRADDDDEWCATLRKNVRDSYRGFDEAALRERCESFDRKLLQWRGKSFRGGLQAVADVAILSFIKGYM